MNQQARNIHDDDSEQSEPVGMADSAVRGEPGSRWPAAVIVLGLILNVVWIAFLVWSLVRTFLWAAT